MKQYLLTIIYPAGALQPEPEKLRVIMENVTAYHDELRAAGAWVFGGGLYPASTATVVSPQDGDVLVTDGPYAESKEQIGGISIIKAPDLDAALGWARKAALATTVPVEVRPFQTESED
jgi:hypothetical protein